MQDSLVVYYGEQKCFIRREDPRDLVKLQKMCKSDIGQVFCEVCRGKFYDIITADGNKQVKLCELKFEDGYRYSNLIHYIK